MQTKNRKHVHTHTLLRKQETSTQPIFDPSKYCRLYKETKIKTFYIRCKNDKKKWHLKIAAPPIVTGASFMKNKRRTRVIFLTAK